MTLRGSNYVHPFRLKSERIGFVSRKDHRDYDAALQKLRTMEATIKKPEGFQPKDIIAICLVAYMALALFPLVPKLGRELTAVVLVLMVGTLWYPAWHFAGWMTGRVKWSRRACFAPAMVVVSVLHVLFGAYVWPPLPYYRMLSRKEIASFNAALDKAPQGTAQIRIGCPPANEEVCVTAEQFLPLFQRAGWKVEGNSLQRISVLKPVAGVTIFQHGIGTADPSNPDQGLWAVRSQSLVQVTNAFTSLGMVPGTAADVAMPEGVLAIYFGPEPKPQ